LFWQFERDGRWRTRLSSANITYRCENEGSFHKRWANGNRMAIRVAGHAMIESDYWETVETIDLWVADLNESDNRSFAWALLP
jgi:hypothetical protein